MAALVDLVSLYLEPCYWCDGTGGTEDETCPWCDGAGCAPADPYEGQAPCPHCFESSGYMARIHPATWWEPSWADSDPMNPCPECHGTGTIDSPLADLGDLEELAYQEEEARHAQ